jgi:Ca-activated chloride channel family protein
VGQHILPAGTYVFKLMAFFGQEHGDQEPSVLRRLAKETGGEAFFPESSSEITSICEEIARDIRSQYTLTYAPANALQDKRYRAIEVKASAPGRGRLSVRTRTGYFVPQSTPNSDSQGARP